MGTIRKKMLYCLFMMPVLVQAQDILVKKDGSRIQSKVLEIGNNEVLYKEWNNQQGETFAIETDDLYRVEFQNGEREVFSEDKAEKEAFLGTGINTDFTEKDENGNRSPNTNNETLNDQWDGDLTFISYNGEFEHADKGSFGIGAHFLRFAGSPIGMSLSGNGIYNLGTKKWLDSKAGCSLSFGLNFSQPLSKAILLYAPLCATSTFYSYDVPGKTIHTNKKDYTTTETKHKTYWGMSLIPSIAIRSGKFVLSAGWMLSYSFETKKFDTKAFIISIAIFS